MSKLTARLSKRRLRAIAMPHPLSPNLLPSESVDGIEGVLGLGENASDTSLQSDTADDTARAFSAARSRLAGLEGPGLEQGRAMLDQIRIGTNALSGAMGLSYTRTSSGIAELNAKAITAWRTNAEALVTHWKKLASVRSLSELITLSSEHAREQIEAMSAQTREFADLAGKITREARAEAAALMDKADGSI